MRMLHPYNSSPVSSKPSPLRSFFKVEIICKIPMAITKLTIPSKIKEPTRSVTGETLRLVNTANTNGSKNTPSITNRSHLGPILTFSGRSAYSTPIATRPPIAFQCGVTCTFEAQHLEAPYRVLAHVHRSYPLRSGWSFSILPLLQFLAISRSHINIFMG